METLNKKDIILYLVNHINTDLEQPTGTFKDLLKYFQTDPYFIDEKEAENALQNFKNDELLDGGKFPNGKRGALAALKANHMVSYDNTAKNIGEAVTYLRTKNLIKIVCRRTGLKPDQQVAEQIDNRIDPVTQSALKIFLDGLNWRIYDEQMSKCKTLEYDNQFLDWQEYVKTCFEQAQKMRNGFFYHALDIALPATELYPPHKQIAVYNSPLKGHKVIDKFSTTFSLLNGNLNSNSNHVNTLHIIKKPLSNNNYFAWQDQNYLVRTANGRSFWMVENKGTYGFILKPLINELP